MDKANEAVVARDKWFGMPEKYAEMDKIVESENLKLAKSFEMMADSIANSIVSLINSLDLFGNKYQEQMATLAATHSTNLATIKINEQVNQKLLQDSYQRGLIGYQEYAIQKTLTQKKATAETKRENALNLINQQEANAMMALDQKIAIATTLQTKAIEFGILAATYAAGAGVMAAFSWVPGVGVTAAGFLAQAQGYAIMAGLLGAGSAVYGSPGSMLAQKAQLTGQYNTQRADVEGQYNKDVGLAQNQANQQSAMVNSNGGSSTGGTISGSVTAQQLNITIAPVITIRGETVIMSDIGVNAAAGILGDFTVKRIQDAINNKEIQLGNN
jgi:hypothetical protein